MPGRTVAIWGRCCGHSIVAMRFATKSRGAVCCNRPVAGIDVENRAVRVRPVCSRTGHARRELSSKCGGAVQDDLRFALARHIADPMRVDPRIQGCQAVIAAQQDLVRTCREQRWSLVLRGGSALAQQGDNTAAANSRELAGAAQQLERHGKRAARLVDLREHPNILISRQAACALLRVSSPSSSRAMEIAFLGHACTHAPHRMHPSVAWAKRLGRSPSTTDTGVAARLDAQAAAYAQVSNLPASHS